MYASTLILFNNFITPRSPQHGTYIYSMFSPRDSKIMIAHCEDYLSATMKMDISSIHQVGFMCRLYIVTSMYQLCVQLTYLDCVRYVRTQFCLQFSAVICSTVCSFVQYMCSMQCSLSTKYCGNLYRNYITFPFLNQACLVSQNCFCLRMSVCVCVFACVCVCLPPRL